VIMPGNGLAQVHQRVLLGFMLVIAAAAPFVIVESVIGVRRIKMRSSRRARARPSYPPGARAGPVNCLGGGHLIQSWPS
jgi:hypothetical protein